eukprot:4874978-Heterocapsa_arctica.AAC.1
MLQLSNASGASDSGEESSQVLRGIPQADNPLRIPAEHITGARYEHPANRATVDFWRSAERNESFRTGTGPPGSISNG